MSERIFNFSAGPACLPESVLKQAQKDLYNIADSGIGILEHSHRGKVFDKITHETEALCRQVGGIPDDYSVFWMQGGATSQCYMVPANFLGEGQTADYFQTGKWANDSIKEVPLYGNCHICGSSKATNYDRIPAGSDIKYSSNPVYVQFTANNTIVGTEWSGEPQNTPEGSFLVSDASSNIFSRPIDVTKYGLIYAGAQKNLGPSGITLLIARKSVLELAPRPLPEMVRYKNHAEAEGRFNTPNTFGVYLMGEVFKWILAEGGVKAMAEQNAEKAGVVYRFLDSQDFYKPHAQKDSRSTMNITFKCPTPELDAQFTADADKRGLSGLTGHRITAGMRASMYNAFPKKGAETLVAFMKDFAHQHAAAAKA
jgi:phosphoserine aminotransferase|tara:strand:- start:1767 stop:2873 length:1107 start_codon:yes stop_codon:yes gene_type:complete